jgi:hydrogenase maturation protease
LQAADIFLERMARSAPQQVTVDGRLLRPGSKVRLRPRPGGDLLDMALAGRVALIEGIDEDDAGTAHVAVILEDDPGRDLGAVRHPAHRFFFAPCELEPLDPQSGTLEAQPGTLEAQPGTLKRVLVAGIGNVFLGDDAFGVAVARLLLGRPIPAGIEVADFGIRGMDLAFALGGYDAAVLVDAVPRGLPPGSLCLIEPDREPGELDPADSHQMNPLAVLGLAARLGPLPPRLLIVGCEPQRLAGEADSMSMEMSPAVAQAVERAADLVLEIAGRLAQGGCVLEATPQ